MRVISFREHDNWDKSKYRPYEEYHKRVKANRKIAKRRSSGLARTRTKAESALQAGILKYRLMYDFQKPIRSAFGHCIVDFYFPRGKELPLVVEVDGSYHDDEVQKRKDGVRSDFIRRNTGATVIRFTNAEVLNDIEGVMQKILAHRPIVMSSPVA